MSRSDAHEEHNADFVDPLPWRDVYGERWAEEGNDLRFYRPRLLTVYIHQSKIEA